MQWRSLFARFSFRNRCKSSTWRRLSESKYLTSIGNQKRITGNRRRHTLVASLWRPDPEQFSRILIHSRRRQSPGRSQPLELDSAWLRARNLRTSWLSVPASLWTAHRRSFFLPYLTSRYLRPRNNI